MLVRDDIKAELIRIGKFGEFIELRSELLEQGRNAFIANREAVRKFLGDEAADSEKPVKWKKPKVVVEADAEKAKLAEELASGVREPNTDSSFVASVPFAPPPVKRSAFDGKPDVGEVENITWVADHMRIVDVSPDDCPSLRAWNLLCECRESPKFRADFWKDHYGKTIPSKSTLDGNVRAPGMDGKLTSDLIDRIQKAHDDAIKEADDGS